MRAKRATLPKLWWWGARPKVLVFLHLNHRFLRESLFSINTHAIISPLSHVSRMLQKPIDNSDGSPFIPSNIHHKRKKTKTFGLVPHHHSLDRVARCARNLCPLKRPTAKAVVRSAPWLCSHEPTWHCLLYTLLFASCTLFLECRRFSIFPKRPFGLPSAVLLFLTAVLLFFNRRAFAFQPPCFCFSTAVLLLFNRCAFAFQPLCFCFSTVVLLLGEICPFGG